MMNKKPMMEDEQYKEFFQSALKKFKVSSPADFKSDEEKKKFFDYVDKNYKAENEEVGLDEGVSPHRKTFIIHATEIANKLKKANPDAGEKDIMNALYKVMSNMTLPADNPNYKNTSRYMPDKFDKKLYDNGKDNTYDSEWMKMKDAQRETVFKAAVKSLGLKESANVELDELLVKDSEKAYDLKKKIASLKNSHDKHASTLASTPNTGANSKKRYELSKKIEGLKRSIEKHTKEHKKLAPAEHRGTNESINVDSLMLRISESL